MSSPSPRTNWSRIYEDVKIQIPGVTDAVFKQVLYQVFGDFTDRTNIWTEEVPIPVDPDNLAYTFTLANKGMPNRLLVLYDPQRLPAKQWVQSGIEMSVPGQINLMYAPSTATTWNAVVAKTTNEVNTDGYPDVVDADQWILNKYNDGLAYGVLGRLQAMPAKPYTNLKLAGVNWQYYVAERSRARTDWLKANVWGGQRWMYPQSFATASRKGWT